MIARCRKWRQGKCWVNSSLPRATGAPSLFPLWQVSLSLDVSLNIFHRDHVHACIEISLSPSDASWEESITLLLSLSFVDWLSLLTVSFFFPPSRLLQLPDWFDCLLCSIVYASLSLSPFFQSSVLCITFDLKWNVSARNNRTLHAVSLSAWVRARFLAEASGAQCFTRQVSCQSWLDSIVECPSSPSTACRQLPSHGRCCTYRK